MPWIIITNRSYCLYWDNSFFFFGRKNEFAESGLTIFRDFDPKGQFVTNAYSFNLSRSTVEDTNPRWRCFRCTGNTDHFRISDRHHAECNILRGHIVCTFNFVDFVGLCHYHRMMLQYNRVRIYSSLKTVTLPWWKESTNRDYVLKERGCALL